MYNWLSVNAWMMLLLINNLSNHISNQNTGTIGDMQQLGIRESYKSKLQVLVSAAEAAEMILRVDDIIKCAPRQRQ